MNPNTDRDGVPIGSEPSRIPFALPSLDDREEQAVLRVLRSGWLTTAKECLAFESEFAAAVGASHAVAVSSGTAGLHLALEALRVRPGDRVVTTPYTFAASAEVVRYLGADPVFVDIRPDDLNMDPDLLARALDGDSRIKAAIPVHVAGHPCAMDEILGHCRGAAVRVIEDAAHAFPGTLGGRFLGTLGDAGVYSFYATKTITTGEGGMIVTEDSDVARRMSVMRLHGMDREAWDRYTSARPSWQYEIVDAGYKYNLPDILAAIGRVQLTKATQMANRRREIAQRYHEELSDRDYLQLPLQCEETSWHLFVVRVRPDRLTIDRNTYIERLAARGIGTSVHFIPLHIMPYYRDRYGLRPEDFPVSLKAYETAMSLPIYPGLSDESVQRIITEVRRIGDAALRH